MNKMPRHVAKVAARYEGSGYISSSQYAELEYAAILDCKEAVSDHEEELERVRREAYRQGVEDARCARTLEAAQDDLLTARAFYDREQVSPPRTEHDMEIVRRLATSAVRATDDAFRGARGIARVEIRQRLEQLSKEARG